MAMNCPNDEIRRFLRDSQEDSQLSWTLIVVAAALAFGFVVTAVWG